MNPALWITKLTNFTELNTVGRINNPTDESNEAQKIYNNPRKYIEQKLPGIALLTIILIIASTYKTTETLGIKHETTGDLIATLMLPITIKLAVKLTNYKTRQQT